VLLAHRGRDGRLPLLDHADLMHESHDFGGVTSKGDRMVLQFAIHERRVTTSVEEVTLHEGAVDVCRLVVEDNFFVFECFSKNSFQVFFPNSKGKEQSPVNLTPE
jgi:hypothetical protein